MIIFNIIAVIFLAFVVLGMVILTVNDVESAYQEWKRENDRYLSKAYGPWIGKDLR